MISALGGKLPLSGDKHANLELVNDEIDKFISGVQVSVGHNKTSLSFFWNSTRLPFCKSYELQHSCERIKWLFPL